LRDFVLAGYLPPVFGDEPGDIFLMPMFLPDETERYLS